MELVRWISDAGLENVAAVLLSGGRDSLLASALVLENRCSIVPVICDNGHMEGVDRARYAVHHLQEVYCSKRVADLVVCKTGIALLQYMQKSWIKKSRFLAQDYPDLLMYQVHCLACKTAMYGQLLRFCNEHGIKCLVDGVRKCQGFFVDLEEMHERFTELCERFGVDLLTPVYGLESDLERKRMLNDRGLPTKTLEPQCFLGCPMKGALGEEERRSLVWFYDKELKKYVLHDIQRGGAFEKE